MSQCKLLNIPDLPLRRILFQFDNASFIQLSLCSKTTKELIKKLKIKHHIDQLNVSFEPEESRILWYTKHFRFCYIYILPMPKNSSYSYENITNGISFSGFHQNEKNVDWVYETYWKDPMIGGLTLINHIVDLMNYQIDYVRIEKFHELKQETIEENEVKEIEKKVALPNRLNVISTPNDKRENTDDFVYLIKNIKTIDIAEFRYNNIDSRVELNFSGTFYKKLKISPAFWLKLEHILQMQFIMAHIYTTRFTSEEVNEILKKWKEGWDIPMRVLEIWLEESLSFDEEEVLRGLDAVRWRDKVTVEYCIGRNKCNRSSGKVSIENGWSIVRECDGAQAVVKVEHPYRFQPYSQFSIIANVSSSNGMMIDF